MTHPHFICRTLATFGLLTSVAMLTACRTSETEPSVRTQPSVVQTTVSSSTGTPTSRQTLVKPQIHDMTEETDDVSEDVETSEIAASVDTTEELSEDLSENTETITETTPSSFTSHSSLDLDAISQGDLNSLNGTWTNSNGMTLVVSDGKIDFLGQGAPTKSATVIAEEFLRRQSSVSVYLGFYTNEERHGGAVMYVLPIGSTNALGMVTETEHLEIGHSASAGYLENQFYRQ